MSGEGPAPRLALVAAVARNGVIGSDRQLPWRLPGDLKHFKALTMGKPVLMGRRTYESIGRPLPGRHVVVLSRDTGFAPAGVTLARTLEAALRAGEALARTHGADEVMVAGGGFVYAALIDQARRLYLTEVEAEPDGDTVFPPIDRAVFRETARTPSQRGPADDCGYAFVVLDRD